MTDERVEELSADDPDYIMIRDYKAAHNIDRDCNTPDVIVLMRRARAASERRASEAERTFAGLHTEMAKIVALNAQLVRERDEARASVRIYNDVVPVLTAERGEAVRDRDAAIFDKCAFKAMATVAQSERDEARAALGKVVEAATKVMKWADDLAPYADDGMPLVPVFEELRTALTHTGNGDA